MTGPLIVLAVFVVLAAIIAGSIAAYKAHQARIESLAAIANRRGWSFSQHKDRSHDDRFWQFAIFRRGHSRASYNTLRGSLKVLGDDAFVQMGDYTYKITSGSGKNRSTTTYHFSYLIVELPVHPVPDLLVRAENLFDKMAGVLGFNDINFESAEFSRRFFVKSPDKRFAYDLITPRMMEFFLEGCPVPGLPAIDMENSRICISNGSSIWKPEQYEGAIAWTERFFELWPEHLVAALREQGR
ncbi:MAG: hypothetical protein ACNA8P_11700 [Phycisphaerales bacterium]